MLARSELGGVMLEIFPSLMLKHGPDFPLEAADSSRLIQDIASLNTPGGKVTPNLEAWRTADVLVSRSGAAIAASAIAFAHTLRSAAGDPLWSHVAIYRGSGFVTESNPTEGVQSTSLGAFLRDKKAVRLVRLRGLGRVSRKDLTKLIDSMGHQPYGLHYFTMVLLGFPETTAMRLAGALNGRYVCSNLVVRVLSELAGRPVLTNLPVVFPGDFVDAAEFDSIPLEWRSCIPS